MSEYHIVFHDLWVMDSRPGACAPWNPNLMPSPIERQARMPLVYPAVIYRPRG